MTKLVIFTVVIVSIDSLPSTSFSIFHRYLQTKPKYLKRRLTPCQKKSYSTDDDEGCQTRVGRTMSRAGADHEKARSRLGAG